MIRKLRKYLYVLMQGPLKRSPLESRLSARGAALILGNRDIARLGRNFEPLIL
jgi:hypothetical protein